MASTNFNADGYRLQPRINLRRDVELPSVSNVVREPTFIHSLIFGRSEKNCKETPDSNTCEKPVGGTMTIYIVLAVV